jgi:hypothetical protein
MATEDVVERLYEENARLREFLAQAGETSFLVAVDDQFRKTLLLAIASQFEHSISNAIIAYAIGATSGDNALVSFVRAKAIARQYHTFFNWDAANANHFFGLFGDSFKEFILGRVAGRADLQTGIRSFMTLGSLRNHLVHKDYATFPLDKTSEEIRRLYLEARVFVGELPSLLSEHAAGATRLV